MQDLSWDVICFGEIRTAAASTALVGGHVLITHVGSMYSGVGILLNANFSATCAAHRNFGDRVLAVKLRIAHAKLSVIGVYLPHAGHSKSCLEDTYAHLAEATKRVSRYGQCYLVGGDFNTSLDGSFRHAELMDYIGPFNLTVANSQQDDTIELKHTFRSSLGSLRQLDYILVGPGLLVNYAWATDSLCLGSDHRTVERSLSRKYPGRQSYKKKAKQRKIGGHQPNSVKVSARSFEMPGHCRKHHSNNWSLTLPTHTQMGAGKPCTLAVNWRVLCWA